MLADDTETTRGAFGQYHALMARTARVVGLVLAFAGAVWTLQGLNSRFAPQSFMTGSRAWILYGAVTMVAGVALTLWGRRL